MPTQDIPLQQRLYIVGIPAGQIGIEATRVQRLLAGAFHLYDGPPPSLHLTLAVAAAATDAALHSVCEAVGRALQPTPTVELQVTGYTCIPTPNSSFAMEVEPTLGVTQLSLALHRELTAASVQLLSDPANWILHITLISNLFSRTPLPPEGYCRLCRTVRRPLTGLKGHLSAVEVWRPDLSNRDVARFPLG